MLLTVSRRRTFGNELSEAKQPPLYIGTAQRSLRGNTAPRFDAGDLVVVTRLDRLARSTRDLLNVLASIADRKAGFRSLGDAWAGTTTPHAHAQYIIG